MLVRLIKYLRGYVKIRVEGYSPERFLNLCNVHKILVWDVENQGFACSLCVSVKDYKKMRPLVRKTRTKISLLERHGLPFFLYKFRKRKMFFAGMLLCVVLIYSLSLFVWNIHIEGNVSQSTEEILDYLENLEIGHGTRKSKIVCEEIETKLRNQYPNILWVSAEMRGTRIIIQIKENTDADIISKVERKDTEPVSIVSEADGIVESMIVRTGTPLVSVGEEVSAGQTLVEGYYAIKNDAGEVVRYEGVPADADILILTTENYSDQFPIEYEEKLFTKKKHLSIRAEVFAKTFEWKPKISFANYDTVTKIKEIHVTENFYLPFSVEFTWYREYVPEMKTYTKEQLRELVEQRFLKKYKNILQKGVQIIEKDVKININGKLCHVSGTTNLLVPADTEVPTVIPEITMNASEEGDN